MRCLITFGLFIGLHVSATVSHIIKTAFSANIKPAILLQITAISIALIYFNWPSATPYFEHLSKMKTNYGVWYAIISTSFFGGFLPYLFLYFSRQIVFKPFKQLIFYCLLWAFMGFLMDNFYTLQAHMFGHNNDFATILKKVLFDQFVFSVLITTPFITVVFLYRDVEFSFSEWRLRVNKHIITQQIPATLISTWIVWIPSVSVIYTMPSSLQVPLFNIVLCLFVLILTLINQSDPKPDGQP